jgi:hypothetical protein
MCAYTLGEACNWRLWLRLNYVQNTVENIGEDNQKAKKIGWGINHKLAPGLEHDEISGTMGFKYPVKKRVGEGMTV